MMIRHGGVEPDKEMKVVPLGSTGARFGALKEGIVDVVVLSPPSDSEGVKQGFNVVARAHEAFQMPFSGLGTNLKRLKERPDEVKRMIKALIRASRYVRQNRDGAVQTLMKWGRTDRESAEATYESTWKIFTEDGNMSAEGLKLVIDQGRESGKIARAVAIAEVAEFGPLREAQRELSIKPR
jgi:ABC-type nitrate/sulfonate/bicarbonate transport system substrate-binding protein